VEILVEEDVILEMRVGLKLFVVSENRAPAVRTPQKEPDQTPAQLISDLIKTHHHAGSSRAFEGEPVSVELIDAGFRSTDN
jgi:hypothetical protein